MAPSRVTLETGTTALTGLSCYKIKCITACVFTTLTGVGGDAISGATFPALFEIEGNITAITASSGTYLVYET